MSIEKKQDELIHKRCKSMADNISAHTFNGLDCTEWLKKMVLDIESDLAELKEQEQQPEQSAEEIINLIEELEDDIRSIAVEQNYADGIGDREEAYQTLQKLRSKFEDYINKQQR